MITDAEKCAAAEIRGPQQLPLLGQKELYYLTCEMHAELWRLERMTQAYKRFEVLRLRTGALSSQADVALQEAKTRIQREWELPPRVALQLRCAADALAGELLRVELTRRNDKRLTDFNVQTDLLVRLAKLQGVPAAC